MDASQPDGIQPAIDLTAGSAAPHVVADPDIMVGIHWRTPDEHPGRGGAHWALLCLHQRFPHGDHSRLLESGCPSPIRATVLGRGSSAQVRHCTKYALAMIGGSN